MILKQKLKSFFSKISGYIIPFIQYVPNASIWRGIMSLPLIGYLIAFFQNPSILLRDFYTFFGYPGTYIIYLGTLSFIYSLIYQIIHRKELIKKGPYKYIRHPQYVSIIIMTFGFTITSLETTPVNIIFPNEIFKSSWIVYIWIAEVIAYIFLAKIEDLSLKANYCEDFLNYDSKVPFMFPFFNLNKEKNRKNKKNHKKKE